MKIAIVGSRTITSFNFTEHLPAGIDTIISGGAVGVDTLARDFAASHGLDFIEYLPDYCRYGRSAPIIRNKQIVEAADEILAVWDGKSRGTLFTIDLARKLGKKVHIVMF